MDVDLKRYTRGFIGCLPSFVSRILSYTCTQISYVPRQGRLGVLQHKLYGYVMPLLAIMIFLGRADRIIIGKIVGCIKRPYMVSHIKISLCGLHACVNNML